VVEILSRVYAHALGFLALLGERMARNPDRGCTCANQSSIGKVDAASQDGRGYVAGAVQACPGPPSLNARLLGVNSATDADLHLGRFAPAT